ncbi:MAG: nitroreductase family protein [Candidatus Marinimicrobia bacterium]|nr:nitroreductase family protein [Candidatus Neomarinimicrobiota bacterium]
MIKILRNRKSVRKFSNEKIAEQDLKILKECLLRAPSSRNKQPWEFIFVDSKILVEQLAESKLSGSQFLKNAPLAIVIGGNETISDVWIEDCSIAAIILQLTAVSLNLGSCWIQIRNRMHDEKTSSEEFVQNLLDIPKNIRILSIIALGHPSQEKHPVYDDELCHSKIKLNQYSA